MTLSHAEAEAFLAKVFSDEIGPGGTVKIGMGGVPGINVPFHLVDRMLGEMAKNGMKIEAIKMYRELNPGMGLADAKAHVEKLS